MNPRTTPTDLYATMVRFLVDNGWTRQEEGSGWWWREGFDEATIGEAVSEQLAALGIDARVMLEDEPRRFWDTEEAVNA